MNTQISDTQIRASDPGPAPDFADTHRMTDEEHEALEEEPPAAIVDAIREALDSQPPSQPMQQPGAPLVQELAPQPQRAFGYPSDSLPLQTARESSNDDRLYVIVAVVLAIAVVLAAMALLIVA